MKGFMVGFSDQRCESWESREIHREIDSMDSRVPTVDFPLYWLVNRDPYNGL